MASALGVSDAVLRRRRVGVARGRTRLGDVFTDGLIDGYLELKQEEVDRLNMTTHPVEFDMYYSV